MFKFFFKKWAKEEIDSPIRKLSFHISNSFLNVKKDMDALSSENSVNSEKFVRIEQRMEFLEKQILIILSSEKTPKEEIELPSRELKLLPETVLESLTFTQKKLLFALYEYQEKLESPISLKSLAKIMYPDKKYGQVRTTITEYLDVLASNGLIQKTRRRRQSYAQMTENGVIMVKENLKAKRGRKKQKID
jgi:hypothetical protein